MVSPMRRTSITIPSLFLLSAFAGAASPRTAEARGVGLGVAAGVAVPDGGDVDFDAAFNWGFFVDIPLISTFHITPSTLLYNFNGVDATDVSLNFKFMIPLGLMELFVGVMAGLTSSAVLDPHAGVLAGASINLLANVDIFAQANYKFVLRDDDTTVRDLQIYAGPLFRFY